MERLLARELGDTETAALRGHLDGCGDCRERWVALEEDAKAFSMERPYATFRIEHERRKSEQTRRRPLFAWASVAAFWAEGSMAESDEPELEAPPELAGKAAGGAVSLAASEDLESLEERRRAFIALGIEVSNGSNRWDAAG